MTNADDAHAKRRTEALAAAKAAKGGVILTKEEVSAILDRVDREEAERPPPPLDSPPDCEVCGDPTVRVKPGLYRCFKCEPIKLKARKVCLPDDKGRSEVRPTVEPGRCEKCGRRKTPVKGKPNGRCFVCTNWRSRPATSPEPATASDPASSPPAASVAPATATSAVAVQTPPVLPGRRIDEIREDLEAARSIVDILAPLPESRRAWIVGLIHQQCGGPG
jgi:hypothetical protein